MTKYVVWKGDKPPFERIGMFELNEVNRLVDFILLRFEIERPWFKFGIFRFARPLELTTSEYLKKHTHSQACTIFFHAWYNTCTCTYENLTWVTPSSSPPNINHINSFAQFLKTEIPTTKLTAAATALAKPKCMNEARRNHTLWNWSWLDRAVRAT